MLCCCVIGPSGKGRPLIFATVFNGSLIALVTLLIWSTNVKNLFIFIQLALTAITELLMVYVACKDPGFINVKTFNSSLVKPLSRSDNDINDNENVF